MRILKKRNILKLAATFMLVGMMAGAFAMHTKAAFAEPAAACDPAINVVAPGNCDMTVTATTTGILEFTNTATVAVGTVTTGANPFQFTTTVIDSRTTPTTGWRLQAVSPGLVSGSNTIPLTIGDSGSSCLIAAAACAGFTAISIPLPDATEATAQTFAGEDGTDGDGTYTLTTHGNFTVADTTPGGSYSATITISLLTSFT